MRIGNTGIQRIWDFLRQNSIKSPWYVCHDSCYCEAVKICRRVHISFDYNIGNLNYPPGAKASIFGTWTDTSSNARDLARIGHMWLNKGKWKEKQGIPQDWLEQAVCVAPDILEN